MNKLLSVIVAAMFAVSTAFVAAPVSAQTKDEKKAAAKSEKKAAPKKEGQKAKAAPKKEGAKAAPKKDTKKKDEMKK
jgi:hypothetical protein